METDWREKYYALSDKFREATEKTLQTSLITSADLLQLTKSNGILEKELVLVREENGEYKNLEY